MPILLQVVPSCFNMLVKHHLKPRFISEGTICQQARSRKNQNQVVKKSNGQMVEGKAKPKITTR